MQNLTQYQEHESIVSLQGYKCVTYVLAQLLPMLLLTMETLPYDLYFKMNFIIQRNARHFIHNSAFCILNSSLKTGAHREAPLRCWFHYPVILNAVKNLKSKRNRLIRSLRFVFEILPTSLSLSHPPLGKEGFTM